MNKLSPQSTVSTTKNINCPKITPLGSKLLTLIGNPGGRLKSRCVCGGDLNVYLRRFSGSVMLPLHLQTGRCMCERVCMPLHACVYLCVRTCAYPCVCMCVRVSVHAYVHTQVSMCLLPSPPRGGHHQFCLAGQCPSPPHSVTSNSGIQISRQTSS